MTVARWIKVSRGHYRLDGTPYAVMSDGYTPSLSITGDSHYEGFAGGEWAVVDTRTDDNLDWWPTMREARAHAERLS